jgi:hypothetical protein
MSVRARSSLWWLVLLTVVAAVLRFYTLGDSPYRGDEAFAVRYWAAPLDDLLRQPDGLAWREPHPIGTFLLFGAWRGGVGESEVAMRTLPLLVNLLGVAGMMAVGRRLFQDRWVGIVGGALWALNPHLIWHAQDARNYAIWAALSVCAVWALLRVTDPARQPRRRDWALYISLTVIASHVFFLEAFLIAAHGAFVLIARRARWRAWLGAAVIIGVLWLPTLYQASQLASSGYQGTGGGADVGALLTLFPKVLLFGDVAFEGAAALAFVLVGVVLMIFSRRELPSGVLPLLGVWAVLPALLLLIAATRMSVFWPRYLIAITPALLLPIAWVTVQASRKPRLIFVVGLFSAVLYYSLELHYLPDRHKAPDWFSLRDYLRANVRAEDAVIMTSLDPATGATDPAFAWYYPGPAEVFPLPHPGFDIPNTVQAALASKRAVWHIVAGSDTRISEALGADGVLISDQGAGRSFAVRQYRARTSAVETPDHALDFRARALRLKGYSLATASQIGDTPPDTLTVLLYWDGTADPQLTVSVQLLGPPRADGSPLWAQEDRPIAAAGRDLYTLSLRDVPPGMYQVVVVVYDAQTGERATFSDGTGAVVGEAVTLQPLAVR